MKVVFIVIAIVVIAFVIFFFILGQQSASGKAIGLVDTRLAQCASKPNCVCSEYQQDAEHYIKPLLPIETVANSKVVLKKVIQKMGGKIKTETANYIAATFTSKLFRFVDDLEIRIDAEKNIIHLRSASRVGHSDIGVNKRRIELLKKIYRANGHKLSGQ